MSILAKSLHVFELENEYKEEEKQIISGGYNISELLNNDNEQSGGGPDIFKDLQIPLGLYCDDVIIKDFYKSVKSNVIEDDLFDRLFDLVSKSKNKTNRKEKVNPNKITKKKGK